MKKKKLLLIVLCVLAMLIATSSVVCGVTHPDKYKYYTKTKGVDVSYWNGTSTNYEKVKAAGYKFVIIRLGYSTLGSFTMNADSTFATNYKKAKAAGLKVGVYYYAQATSTSEATKEANYVISKLKGYNLDLPVVYDFEKPSGNRLAIAYSSWVKNYGVSYARKRCTDISLTFLNKIKASGRSAMFYSYRALMDPSFSSGACLNMSSIDTKYPVWIAQYSSSIGYGRSFNYWQYSSTTKVSGMSGYVDVNYWYYRQSYDMSKCTISTIANQKYTGSAKTPKLTVKYGSTKLIEGTDYYVTYSNNTNIGTATAKIVGMNNPKTTTKSKTFKIVQGTPTITAGSSSYIISPARANMPFNLSAKSNSGGQLTYSSSNTSIATVDASGNVTTTGVEGSTTITIKTAATTNYVTGSKQIVVTTGKAIPIISTSSNTYSRLPSSNPFGMSTTTESDGVLSYTSSDNSVATVSANNLVTTTGKLGTAIITIRTSETDNYKAGSKQVKVVVAKRTTTISTNYSTYNKTTLSSKTFSLHAKRTSSGALSFTSSNTSIAKVSTSGIVTLTGKVGKAKITIRAASTQDDNSAKRTVTVSVKKVSPKITASSKTKTYGSKSFNLKAKASYSRSLSYKTSSKKVATVNSKGKIYIKGTGKSTITITAKGNSKYNTVSKKITITVKPKKAVITSLRKSKRAYFTVKYRKDSKSSGYQIKYSTSKSFRSNVASKYVGRSTTKKTIKVYYPKKRYYVKVRAYKIVKGKKVYGTYSSTKSVSTK